jgi:hypothetical protein
VAALAEPKDTSAAVILRTPRGRGALPIMRVVIGGVASRHALSVDLLDDLELAVETLFREEPVEGEDLTMTVRVADDCIMVTLGGLKSRLVRRTLITDLGDCQRADQDGRSDIVRMLMDSLVDAYRAAEAAGDSFSVELQKRIS